MTKPSDIHDPGWWDEHGVPAHWPHNFPDPNSGWQPAGTQTAHQNGDQPPF